MKETTFVATKCLRPVCRNKALHGKRGLCGTCYNAACISGRSWEELIKERKALPKRESAKEWFAKQEA